MHSTSPGSGFGTGLLLSLGLTACSPGVAGEEAGASVAPIVGRVTAQEVAEIDRMVESLPKAEGGTNLKCQPSGAYWMTETHPDVGVNTRAQLTLGVTRIEGAIRRTVWKATFVEELPNASRESTSTAEYVYNERQVLRYVRRELSPVASGTGVPIPDTPSVFYVLDDDMVVRRTADDLVLLSDLSEIRAAPVQFDGEQAVRVCKPKP
jgi:hypothetical protein